MLKTANHRFTAVAEVEASGTLCFVGIVHTQNELSTDLAGDTFDDAFEDPFGFGTAGLDEAFASPAPASSPTASGATAEASSSSGAPSHGPGHSAAEGLLASQPPQDETAEAQPAAPLQPPPEPELAGRPPEGNHCAPGNEARLVGQTNQMHKASGTNAFHACREAWAKCRQIAQRQENEAKHSKVKRSTSKLIRNTSKLKRSISKLKWSISNGNQAFQN